MVQIETSLDRVTTDTKNGDILRQTDHSTKKIKTKRVEAEAYVKQFPENIPDGVTMSATLRFILGHFGYAKDGAECRITRCDFEFLAKEINPNSKPGKNGRINFTSVYNQLIKLRMLGVIEQKIKDSWDVVIVNPFMYAKGSEYEINAFREQREKAIEQAKNALIGAFVRENRRCI